MVEDTARTVPADGAEKLKTTLQGVADYAAEVAAGVTFKDGTEVTNLPSDRAA